jgi:putative FmdB family regulatory protein
VPIYEFRCGDCRKRTSVFVRTIGAGVSPLCEHCGSDEMSRLFSRVAVLRSEDDMGAGIDESSLGDIDENDPRSVARWVRKMSRDMGEPLDAEMEADLERMEAGEMPDDDMADEPEEDFADVE